MNPSVGVPTVLVVDDEPDILEAMREFLATSLPQARVLTASSGAQGLAILGRDDVDLILTDYKMPEMNGIDFLKAAHRLRPDIPCLLITAYDLDARAQRAVQPEIIGLFPKPIDPSQMLNQVRSYFNRRRDRPAVKRHEALRPLSRDHHFLLRHAQALARAADDPLDPAWRAYAEFRRHDLAPHAQEEELLSRSCGVPMPPLTAALDPAASREDVVDSLRRHVRACEEEAFPMAEARLGDPGLRTWSEESARFRGRHRRAPVCDIVARA